MDTWVTFFGRTTYIQRIVGNTHKFLDNKLSLSLSLIKAITQYKKLRSSTIRPRLWSRNDLSIFREIIQDSAIYSFSLKQHNQTLIIRNIFISHVADLHIMDLVSKNLPLKIVLLLY